MIKTISIKKEDFNMNKYIRNDLLKKFEFYN